MADSEPGMVIFTDKPASSWVWLNRRPIQVGAFGSDSDLTNVSVVVIDGENDVRSALEACRRIGTHSQASILFIAADGEDRTEALKAGADAVLAAAAPIEMIAQVDAIFRRTEMSHAVRRKAEEADRFNRQLQDAYEQIKLDLDMAGRLQSSFMPKAFPEIGRVRFAVHYRPHGPVGGDFYDVIRLDERHLGFYLADVMGHGVPAGLLAIYLKRAVVTKEITANGYRIVPPDEVLKRLNQELIQADIAEQPFATMIYGVIDSQSGKVSLARAAHPNPLVLRAKGSSDIWDVPGSTLLGVFESTFHIEVGELKPGDILVLNTDGIVEFLPESAERDNQRSLLKLAKEVDQRPVARFVDALAATVFERSAPKDDATLLAVEYLE